MHHSFYEDMIKLSTIDIIFDYKRVCIDFVGTCAMQNVDILNKIQFLALKVIVGCIKTTVTAFWQNVANYYLRNY